MASCVEVAGRMRAQGDLWNAALLLGDACIAEHVQACAPWREVARQLCQEQDASWCRGLLERFDGKSERLDTSPLREVLRAREDHQESGGTTPGRRP